MTYNKYILILCVFIASCKNESSTTTQEATKSTNSTEVIAPKEVIASAEMRTATEQKPEETSTPKSSSEKDTVIVSNLVDLVANAKSNTLLILEKGTYRLEEDMVYLMTKDERKIIDKKKVETRSIGGQLHFSGLDNFQFVGKKGAVIESENPNAVPLFLLRCNNVKVSNLTVRKKVKGTVDLCYVSDCRDVLLEKCSFSEGGTYGMYINKVDNMNVNNCRITNCTTGAIKIHDSRGINFNNSIFTNNICKVPMVNFYGTGSIVAFNNVSIIDNKRDIKSSFQGSENLFAVGNNKISLDNCVIRNNIGFINLAIGQNSISRTEIEGLNIQ